MTFDPIVLSNSTSISTLPLINIANGTIMNITHTSLASTSYLNFSNINHVTNLTLNLISIGKLCESGLIVIFLLLATRFRIHRWDRFLGQIVEWANYLSFHLTVFHVNICLQLQPLLPLPISGISTLVILMLVNFNL